MEEGPVAHKIRSNNRCTVPWFRESQKNHVKYNGHISSRQPDFLCRALLFVCRHSLQHWQCKKQVCKYHTETESTTIGTTTYKRSTTTYKRSNKQEAASSSTARKI